MQEMIAEFIVDCSENLEEFENNLLDLEKDPSATNLVDSMFRMIHSIKGASGFLAFQNLESLTHKAENVLDLIRQDKGEIDQTLISTFLDVCDAMRTMFGVIQNDGNDGSNKYEDLISQLLNYEEAFKSGAAVESPAAKPEAKAEVQSAAEAQTESSDEQLALDPVQIEALKSLGMYNEDEVASPEPEPAKEEERLELDPVQVEALKALGMYDEKEVVVTEAAAKPEAKKEEVQAPKKEEKKAQATSAPTVVKETIRVEVDTLDRLVNLAGELVLVRNQLLEISKNNESQVFDGSFAELDIVTGEMQRTLMQTRMQPISNVWSKMPRIVRDLAKQLDKDINISMHGETTELDKTIIESIADPMTHIIRNCCDHGIETPSEREAAGKSRQGNIKLSAEHRGNWIHVDIVDDGKGISRAVLKEKALEKELHTQEELDAMDDQQVLNIIFHPGFSTKDQASTVSGRGVGMDVIKSNITKINGTVELASTEGKGTVLKIKLPLTLAIIPAVIVGIDDARFAIPQNAVQEVAAADIKDVENLDNIGGQRFTRLRGEILPLVFASEFLANKTISEAVQSDGQLNYVVINADGYVYGLVIDRVIDIIEIVVKPLDSDEDFEYYAGATIMGDGKVALILDASKIAEISNIDQSVTETTNIEELMKTQTTANLTLLFKLKDGQNYLIPLSKTSRIEEIPREDIEERQVGTFAKFNDSIIRVIDLGRLLGIEGKEEHAWLDTQETLKTLYFEFNGHGIAIDVGFNHLLLQEEYFVEEDHSTEFIIGTALIKDEVFEVLSLEDYLGKVIGESIKTEDHANVQNKDQEDLTENLTGLNLSSDLNSVISFKLDDLWFGIELDAVSEIITQEEVTETPGSRESVQGLLNLRGEIMLTKSLEKILGINSGASNEDNGAHNNRNLIIHSDTNKMCLEIGHVDEILNLREDDFNPAPSNIPQNLFAYLKGVYNIENSMLLLLDEKKLISDIVAEVK